MWLSPLVSYDQVGLTRCMMAYRSILTVITFLFSQSTNRWMRDWKQGSAAHEHRGIGLVVSDHRGSRCVIHHWENAASWKIFQPQGWSEGLEDCITVWWESHRAWNKSEAETDTCYTGLLIWRRRWFSGETERFLHAVQTEILPVIMSYIQNWVIVDRYRSLLIGHDKWHHKVKELHFSSLLSALA